MKKTIAIAVLATVGFLSCSKDAPAPVSECLQSKLLTFDTNSACGQGATVKEYTYQSKSVFVLDPGTCGADLTSEVIDENCATVGYLGGITGNDTILGDSFSNNAVYIRQIWGN